MGLLDGLKQLAAQVTGAQSSRGTQATQGSGASQAGQAGSSSGSNSIFDNAEKTDKQVDISSQLILEFLKTEKHSFQEILEHTSLPANELNVSLMMLEMEGLILKVANNSYIAT